MTWLTIDFSKKFSSQELSQCLFKSEHIFTFVSSLKAVCLAHNYNYRNARIGHRRLLLRYVCPVVVLAILLNIPKLIEISPLGEILKNNYSFWPLFVLYQVNIEFNYLVTLNRLIGNKNCNNVNISLFKETLDK